MKGKENSIVPKTEVRNFKIGNQLDGTVIDKGSKAKSREEFYYSAN